VRAKGERKLEEAKGTGKARAEKSLAENHGVVMACVAHFRYQFIVFNFNDFCLFENSQQMALDEQFFRANFKESLAQQMSLRSFMFQGNVMIFIMRLAVPLRSRQACG
jgi:hypothetical protein